ncbi:xanthine dehydrogenase accessory protein XdhC [Thalassovita mediterranea]|uniref:Xanthine dehydrogenase accessory protein XdhC n=1 Tax=Thalassovita mediterranea TaxID=340021 RepID=A0A0P1GPX5_9RHOB|nr:xanthine dehydrogenase accessory protein XdhC [Thalassovita mediterranea]CUH84285.1 xanthine dehydrogenase accessory protein XdhC [Thalassovita mediterranea]SIS27494.1 xanthine dehydrogenase accessory factor [Thalassovita mediterranea]
MTTPRRLHDFLSAGAPVVALQLTRVRGSSPRGEGTEMFVSADALHGTIGGGQLEHRAIAAARELLAAGDTTVTLDLPLGPEIGQCCGGRVEVTLTLLAAAGRQAALDRANAEQRLLPHVYILGAGHVGRALADQFQHMPVQTIVIDPRADELAQVRADVDCRLSVLPEHDIHTAPPGSAFIVLTHDHGLDFLLTSAALGRGDAAYVGMIGSATKRASFLSWGKQNCDGTLPIAQLNCPIGAGGSRDKRPAVIAALVVAEVITALTSEPAATAPLGATEPSLAAQ